MQILSTTRGGAFGPLSLYISSYLAQVREQGYAVGSLYEQVHVLKMCDRWMQRIGPEVRDLDEAAMRYCLRGIVRHGYGKKAAAAALRRLLAMLRRSEIVQMVTKGKRSAADAARLFGIHPSTVCRLLAAANQS